MSTKHTPGPWFVDGMDIKSFSDPAHIRLAGVHGGRPRDEREANASLIAAAPELLKTLRHVEGALLDITCERTSILKGVRAAIAKAGGAA